MYFYIRINILNIYNFEMLLDKASIFHICSSFISNRNFFLFYRELHCKQSLGLSSKIPPRELKPSTLTNLAYLFWRL
jgi:hypothetical protein